MRSNEEQLELFADLLEPAGEILSDTEVRDALIDGKRAKAIKIAIKNHIPAVIEILALLEGEDPATYKVPGPLGMMSKLLAIVNSEEFSEVFTGQALKDDGASSGPVTDTTPDAGR